VALNDTQPLWLGCWLLAKAKVGKSPTKGTINVRFEKFVGVQYIVLWLGVENQTTPINKGHGMDFFLNSIASDEPKQASSLVAHLSANFPSL
jgi:hypothetical protein